MELVYKIDSYRDRQGKEKTLPKEGLSRRWFIKSIKIGHPAILIDVDDDMELITSKVEDVSVFENLIFVITKNSIYTLKPYVEVVE